MTRGFTEGMRSSLTDQWATPQYLFDKLNQEFGFTLDVCADESNHKTGAYFSKEDDGLRQEWTGVCWMNPPYGREIGKWVKKAYEAARGGGRGGRIAPSQNGHALVEGLRNARIRAALYQRARKIRHRRNRCTIPLGYRHIRHAHDPENITGNI